MKKVLVFVFYISISQCVIAQNNKNPLFNYNQPNELPINIHLNMGNGMKMKLEMYKITDLDSLKNMDALLQKVWADLLPIKDILTKPFVNRRIDYLNGVNHGQFKITEYEPTIISYKYNNDQLIQTKVGEDSLRIGLRSFFKNISDTIKAYRTIFITFTLNKIEDITTLKAGFVDSAISTLQKNTQQNKLTKTANQLYTNYDIIYNNWSPLLSNVANKKRLFFEPDIYLGFQYARGYWISSAATGFQLIHGKYEGERNVYKLLWEPHFFFTRDFSNSLITNRNDFITFRFYHYEKAAKENDYFPMSFSVGYLVSRKGKYYEKNTFKFSVPGLTYKFVSIEPEFIFNDFFKNFSPTLKLNFNID